MRAATSILLLLLCLLSAVSEAQNTIRVQRPDTIPPSASNTPRQRPPLWIGPGMVQGLGNSSLASSPALRIGTQLHGIGTFSVSNGFDVQWISADSLRPQIGVGVSNNVGFMGGPLSIAIDWQVYLSLSYLQNIYDADSKILMGYRRVGVGPGVETQLNQKIRLLLWVEYQWVRQKFKQQSGPAAAVLVQWRLR